MPFYPDPETLYRCLQTVFTRIETEAPQAYRGLTAARLALRLTCTGPAAEVLFDGRRPGQFQAIYGAAAVRPDLEIHLAADTLHLILLDTLPMKKALGGGLVKVRGPAHKLTVFGDVMQAGRQVYPDVLREHALL